MTAPQSLISCQAVSGTTEASSIFLAELEQWRRALARDIAARNTSLTPGQLNLAVQEIINRVIFLRLAEARGTAVHGRMQRLLDGPDIYSELGRLFRRADERYNVGLFTSGRDVRRPEELHELGQALQVGDDALARILRRLYCPESPHEFSALPVAILGQVYEQFLGRVTLNRGHQADVVPKPEARKEGGVYYTPAPIVDHMLDATLSPLLKGRSPQSVAGRDSTRNRHPLRVLDPSCGSGIFLLSAYEYLLRWYLDAYTADGAERWAGGRLPRLRRGPGGDWELTTAERKGILLRHIYGVDIDPRAIEVTKLSLLLMVLGGEPGRVRPDLAGNIKCGNALIEPDFHDHEPRLPDDENQARVNAFEWRSEFSSVFASAGGFDAVIGNPPYLDSETMTRFIPEWRDYCVNKYRAAAGNWDVFCVFIERALDLCRPGGYHSFIVPNKIGSAHYARNIRAIITGENELSLIRDYASVPLFPASVYPVIYSVRKQRRDDTVPVRYERMAYGEAGAVCPVLAKRLDRSRYFRADGSPWAIFADITAASPVERLTSSFPALSAVASVHGAATVAEAYELAPLIQEAPAAGGLRVVNSGTIDRYVNLWGEKPMRYLGRSYVHPVVPPGAAGPIPAARLRQARTPKVIVAGLTRVLECIADLPGALWPAKSTTVIETDADLCWLLGILNSRLMTFYFLSVYGGDRLKGGYLRIGPPQLRTLPVPDYDQANDHHRALAERVRQLLGVRERRPVPAPPAESASVTRRVRVLEEQIDRLVYRIYDLTDAERLVVEQSPGPPDGRAGRPGWTFRA